MTVHRTARAKLRISFRSRTRAFTCCIAQGKWGWARPTLSYLANMYARLITGLGLWDLTAGFKCFRRKVLQAIDLNSVRSNGYGFQVEMNVRAWRKGFVLREIPIVFTDRHDGTSKMSGAIVREAIWMMWRLRWWSLTGRI